MPTPLLPVFCGRCHRVQLQALHAGQTPTCRTCNELSVVLPGETYGEGDVALFERIEVAVRASSITRATAERALWELRDVTRRAEAPESVLLRVLDYLPSLHFLIPALSLEGRGGTDRQRLVKGTGIVAIVVSARLRELEGTRSKDSD